MEKKLNKLGKTMDYMERAKREEETPIFEQAFQQRLVQEQHLHEQEQLKEIELSRQHHAGDLQEKNRLATMLENKITTLVYVGMYMMELELNFHTLDDRIREQVAALKRDREIKWKLLFKLENLKRLRGRRKMRRSKDKLDEIFEMQKQWERELEEKDMLRREALLTKTLEPLRPAEPSSPARPEPAPATAGKYVPRHRQLVESGQGPSAAPLGQSPCAPLLPLLIQIAGPGEMVLILIVGAEEMGHLHLVTGIGVTTRGHHLVLVAGRNFHGEETEGNVFLKLRGVLFWNMFPDF